MAYNDRLKEIISKVQLLSDLADSMIDAEMYPVSFFSQAYDLIQKLQSDFHTMEAEQVEMFAEQLKNHQALILSIHQQMRHFSTQTQSIIHALPKKEQLEQALALQEQDPVQPVQDPVHPEQPQIQPIQIPVYPEQSSGRSEVSSEQQGQSSEQREQIQDLDFAAEAISIQTPFNPAVNIQTDDTQNEEKSEQKDEETKKTSFFNRFGFSSHKNSEKEETMQGSLSTETPYSSGDPDAETIIIKDSATVSANSVSPVQQTIQFVQPIPPEAPIAQPARPAPVEATATPQARTIPPEAPVARPARPIPFEATVTPQSRPIPVEATATPQARTIPPEAPVVRPARPIPVEATATPQARTIPPEAPVARPARPIPVEATVTPQARPIPFEATATPQARPIPPEAPVVRPARPIPFEATATPQARPIPPEAPIARPARPMYVEATAIPQARPMPFEATAIPQARPMPFEATSIPQARPIPPVAPVARPARPTPAESMITAQDPASTGIPSFLSPIGADDSVEQNNAIIQSNQTFNHSLSETPTLNEAIEKKKLSDLRKAFNLNDRFRYQKELFNGSEEEMNKVVIILNNKPSFDESIQFLEQKLHWNLNDPTVQDFIKLLEGRFS